MELGAWSSLRAPCSPLHAPASARQLGLRANGLGHAEKLGKSAADLEVPGADVLEFLAGGADVFIHSQIGIQQIQSRLARELASGLSLVFLANL